MPSHVLIVEDESDLQRVLAYNFRQAGFDVVLVFGGDGEVYKVVCEVV